MSFIFSSKLLWTSKMCFGYRAKIPLRTMKSFWPEISQNQNHILCASSFTKIYPNTFFW
ncbi:hypothetical protein Hanom_Chr06g00513491 [Helianthus anomalus]